MIRGLCVLALLGLAANWVLLQSAVRIVNYSNIAAVFSGDERAVIHQPRKEGGAVYALLEELHRPGDQTLVFGQSDFGFYGTGSWIDNFDEALLDLYRVQSAEEMYDRLKDKGVRFVFLPGYTFSTFYNTRVIDVLGDPRFAVPLESHRGFRLFELRDQPANYSCRRVDLMGKAPSVYEENAPTALLTRALELAVPLPIPRRGRTLALDAPKMFLQQAEQIEPLVDRPRWFSTYKQVYQRAGVVFGGSMGLPPIEPELFIRANESVLQITLALESEAYLEVLLLEHMRGGKQSTTTLADGLLGKRGQPLTLQHNLDSNVESLQLMVLAPKNPDAVLTVSNAELCFLEIEPAQLDTQSVGQKSQPNLSLLERQLMDTTMSHRFSWSPNDRRCTTSGHTECNDLVLLQDNTLGHARFDPYPDIPVLYNAGMIVSDETLSYLAYDASLAVARIQAWIRNQSDSRVASVADAIFGLFLSNPIDPQEPTIAYDLRFDSFGSADAIIQAYVSWRDDEGEVRVVYAGDVSGASFDGDPVRRLQTLLPAVVTSPNLVLVVSGSHVAVTSASLVPAYQ